MKKILLVSLLLLTGANAGAAEADPFGWLWVDYGAGSRYTRGDGRDVAGAAQANLGVNASHGKLSARVLVGGTLFSNDRSQTVNAVDFNVTRITNQGSTNNLRTAEVNNVGTVRIREAYITYDRIGGSMLGLSIGAQPIWFGLKPGGHEGDGDRNIQNSLEFGGAGGFDLSSQVETGLRFFYNLDDIAVFAIGAFDSNEENSNVDDGAHIWDNYFATAKFNELFTEGLYLFLGYQGKYVGGAVDQTKPIFDVGLGFQYRNWFDVSFEYASLNEDIAGTGSSENYYIAKLTIWPTEKASFIFDWTWADKLDAYTIRTGFNYQYNDSISAMLQYALDNENVATQAGVTGERNLGSVDMRLAYNF